MALTGQVALVTGSSRGIGADIAKELARAGVAVAVCARTETQTDARLPGTIHSVAKEIRDEGGTAVGVPLNMRSSESIESAVRRTVAEFGRLDIIVNNAALQVPGTIETVDPKHLSLMWEVDLMGPLLLIREALPHIRQGKRGQIINVSSRAAVFPGPGPYPKRQSTGPVRGSFYGMMKAGLERYTQALAMELEDVPASVNALSPMGRINTPGSMYWTHRDTEPEELEFEPAVAMATAARWICEQEPPTYTGHIDWDEELCEREGLLSH